MLVAEAMYWVFYTDPAGLMSPAAFAYEIGRGDDEVTDEAITALLKGVRDVGMQGAVFPPAAPLNAARDNYLASDSNRIVNAYLDNMARPGKTDAEIERLEDWLCAETRAIWAKPCVSWDDLIVRAAIACHCWDSGPDEIIATTPPGRNSDTQAFAYLVKGIIDLAGLRFDRDGRCTDPEGAAQIDKRAVPTVGSSID